MSNNDIARDAQPDPATASGTAVAGAPDWRTCDGQQWKAMIQSSLAWLNQHIPLINALNVFPVPDGDTGTNMYLTMEAAWQEIAGRTEHQVAPIIEALAHGALMGARGNSGVILSQVFRGMAQALHGVDLLDTNLLARALQQASSTAYKAVIRPVEGTILTVARRMAEAGALAAETTNDLREMFALVVEAARKAVEETPSLLPVLAEAGVVDAGGQGLYVILEGMLRYMRGESVEIAPAPEEEVILHHPEGPEEGYGYDVQFILTGENLDVERIRADIDAMGVSTLVVGDSRTVKVHVHTPEPGTPLNYAARLGSLSRVIVENMQEQYEAFL
ncbi:MAG: DAK2 domain-containing protein, partial [Anaerolineae bacterium]